MTKTSERGRRGRQARKADARTARAGTSVANVTGGGLSPLTPSDVQTIDRAARQILSEIGMADAPEAVAALVCAVGGTVSPDGRLLFPDDLIDRALAGMARDFVLCGQTPEHDMPLTGCRVYAGTGGAAPMVVDLETGRFGPSSLADL